MAIMEDEESRMQGRGRESEVLEGLLQQSQKEIVKSRGRGGRSEESLWMVWLCTAVSVCGSFEFGSCVGFSAPSQKGITHDIDLSLSQYSVFGSILTIGAIIGAITSGRLADFFGRKGAMRISAFFCTVGWIAIYFAEGPRILYFGRLFSGYGMGVLSYVVPIFIAEIAPKNLRGALTTLNQLFICTGYASALIIGTLVTWRTLVLVGLIPCFILFLGLFLIPESPRWLAKVGMQKEFKSALANLRGENADITEEATEIQEYIESLETLPKVNILDLFDRRHIRAVVIGVGLMVFQQLGGINGIGFYVSELFVSAGFSSGRLGTILYAFIQLPITLLGAFLMDKSGRRLLLLVSGSTLFVGCFITGISFYLKGQGICMEWVPAMALLGILVYISGFSIGMGAVPWVIMSEVFSIDIKGTAASLVTLVNWLGSFLVSYTFNFLMSWNSAGTLFIYAAINAASIIFVLKLVPETKGRSLEEIQASLNF